METKCLFCGKKPEDKNKEHVLPQWLLKLTGDPSRKVPIAFDFNNGQVKEFSFNKLTVPSCSNCNSKYGNELESKVKPIVEKLAKYENFTSEDIDLLLDWLDKVRIGLWYTTLNFVPKEFRFEKQLHVDNRIGKADRTLLVYPYRSFKTLTGLSVTGSNNIAFMDMPSAFAIRINKVILINVSTDFFVGRRLGYYFPKNIEFKNDIKRLSVSNITKREKIENSPFRVKLTDNPHVFSQVCYSQDFYDSLLKELDPMKLKLCDRTTTYKSPVFYYHNNKQANLEENEELKLNYTYDSPNTDNFEKLAMTFDLFIYIIQNLKGYNEGSSFFMKYLKKQKKALLDL